MSLWRSGYRDGAQAVLNRVIYILVFGLVMPNVGNYAHVGGFVGGAAVGALCGPSVRSEQQFVRLRDQQDAARGRPVPIAAPVEIVNVETPPRLPLPALLVVLLVAVPLLRDAVLRLPRALQLAATQSGQLSGRRLLVSVPPLVPWVRGAMTKLTLP